MFMENSTNYSFRFFTIIFCFTLFFLGINSTNIFAQDIQIYTDSTAQKIDGFGAANIVGWRPDMTDSEIKEAFGKSEGQLGFSILRIRIPPNSSQWSEYIPTAQKAYDMGVKIIASPWTPPSSMKTNNSTVAGTLKVADYANYAHWLKSFVDYMKNNGVSLYAVSIQNEPDAHVSYSSCFWTPDQMMQFVKEYGDSIGTRLMAPESENFNHAFSDPILKDSAAAAHLNIVAGHIYGGGLEPYPLAQRKGKPVWMTEHYTDSKDPGNLWPLSLDIGNEMQSVMKANMSAYVFWYIVRFYGPIGDGTNGTKAGEITKRGYVMSQFSRFIRPGYLRILTKGPIEQNYSNVSVTAYKDSSQVAIVAINKGTSSQKLNFIMKRVVSGSFQQYVTSSTQNAAKTGSENISNSSFSAVLPAESISTFVSNNLNIVTGLKKETSLPTSYKLSQNYPNPFNPTTTIDYHLPKATQVSLKIYDILGRKIATLVDGRVSAGEHRVRFNAINLASGVYLYRIHAGNFIQMHKMILLK